MINHMYCFGLYGACVISAEMSRRWDRFPDLGRFTDPRAWRERQFWLSLWNFAQLWKQKTFLLSLAQFIVPSALFIVTSPTAGRFRAGGYSLLVKLYGAVALVNTGRFWLDLAICGVCYVGFVLALSMRWLTLDRRVVWVLIGLVVAYPIWPDVIFGSGFAAYRLPVAIAFIAVAASAPSKLGNVRSASWAMAIVALLVVLQCGFFTTRWRDFDREYRRIDRIIDEVPIGKRLLWVDAQPDRYYGLNDPPLSYFPDLSAPSRHIFVNGPFVWPVGNTSISLVGPYKWLGNDPAWQNDYYPPELTQIRAAPLTSKISPFRPEVLAMYDYLMIRDEDSFGLPESLKTHPVGGEGDIRLYKLH
jgi:hypothetical protein